MSGPKLRVLSSGVDSVYLSARGDFREGVLGDLEGWRDQAKDTGQPVRVKLWRTGAPFLVKEHGARGYSFLLTSDDMDLAVGAGKNFPPVRVELRSSFLHSVSVEAAVARALAILAADLLLGPPEVLTSRIDIYADLQRWPLVEADLDRFTTRARFRELLREEMMLDGRRLTGFRFGKADMMVRLYDKTIEIERSGKRWVRDLWGEAFTPGEPVWRLEFQFRRGIIKSLQLSDPAEVLAALQDLWHYATVNWITYRTPTRDARERRWPLHPIWKQVQAIEIAPQMTGLVRQREKELSEERTLRLLLGCMTSLGALNDWTTFGEAWLGARPLVTAQLEARERSFADLVREKAARRMGVTVLSDSGEDAA